MKRFLHRDQHGRFITERDSLAMDLRFFISEWRVFAKDALRRGDRADAMRCMEELKDCKQKLRALLA